MTAPEGSTATRMPRRRDRHPVVERMSYRLVLARAWLRRATVAGLAVRAAVWLTGAVACLLAFSSWNPVALVVAVLFTVPAAVAPRTVWPMLVAVVAIVTVVLASPYPMWQLLTLAGVLYLHHTLAALGAHLRTDTVIPLGVLRHHLGRAAGVLVGSAPVALAIVVLAEQAPGGGVTGYLALGTVMAVGLTVLLVRGALRVAR